jgi:hypothetical protein
MRHSMPSAIDHEVHLIGTVLNRADGDNAVCRMRAQDRMRAVVGAVDEAIEFAKIYPCIRSHSHLM